MLSQASFRNESISERFASLLGRLKNTEDQLSETKSMLAVAEIAAGAAHELNNPLAIISGRSQLLAASENDPNRRQMLKQIEERSNDISGMIADLMTFAKPPVPAKAAVEVKKIVDDALDQVSSRQKINKLELTLSVEGSGQVFVDPKQVTDALANIIVNALESYPGDNGPVEISAQQVYGTRLDIAIRDHGCGMDADTAKKAANPFFCAKAAGRKRGMGLAHASRFLQINGGRLKISSQPGTGTTVTVSLPVDQQ
jgi:signal transduction histidine kinase